MYIIGKKCGEKMKDYSEYFKGPNLKEAQKRSRKQVDHLKDAFEIPSDMVSVGKGKTYYIHTYGCQANERDGETLAGIFEMMGYTVAKEIEEADVILLNTCAIRENAEEKVFGKVGYVKNLKKKKPNLIFGLCGCMAQEEVVIKRILEKHPHIDLIFGTHNIHRLPTLLKEAMFSKEMVVEVWSKEGDVIENTPVTRANGHKAWVNIMYGCNKFCTYCIVPYTRGKERSRLMDDIIEEVKGLKADGYQEITLLGQNVNSYGKDLEEDYDFATLLEEVAKTGIARIRFTTSHPWDFSREMIEIINQYDNIMPYIHLPVQSGNTEILKLMGRRYTREQYLELFHMIKEAIHTGFGVYKTLAGRSHGLYHIGRKHLNSRRQCSCIKFHIRKFIYRKMQKYGRHISCKYTNCFILRRRRIFHFFFKTFPNLPYPFLGCHGSAKCQIRIYI